LDVFALREQVIGERANFFTIHDEWICTRVDATLAEFHLWADPIQTGIPTSPHSTRRPATRAPPTTQAHGDRASRHGR